jgi:hypothetical protein
MIVASIKDDCKHVFVAISYGSQLQRLWMGEMSCATIKMEVFLLQNGSSAIRSELYLIDFHSKTVVYSPNYFPYFINTIPLADKVNQVHDI